MNFDQEQCEMVLRTVYGLAKGKAGISVSVSSVSMQTGFDEDEITRCADLMQRDGRATIPSQGRLALTNAGMAYAKSEAERETDAVFMD